MLNQGALPRHVALVHRANLRDCHVRLINDEHEVVWEEVKESVGRAPLFAAVNVAGIVFDPSAGPDFPHHFNVVGRAHA